MSCPQFMWGPSSARAWKSVQVKGVPFPMGVASEECPGPRLSCSVPGLSTLPCPAGCSPVGVVGWDLGALPKNAPHPNSPSWAAAPWPRKCPEETCLDMCRVY